MLALGSVWIGLAAFLLAAAMLIYRPLFADWPVTLVLFFGSPGALCLAGLVLWAHRKGDASDPSVAAQRLQAKTALILALSAATIVYLLVIHSQKLESPASWFHQLNPKRASPIISSQGNEEASPVARGRNAGHYQRSG